MISNRVNVFIRKVKEAAAKEDKAKSVPKAAPALPEAPPPPSIEPLFDTLEEALEAAHKCSKRLPTKMGTKGCRTCMGKWFEEIRQSGAKSGPFRRVYSKSSGS